MEFLLDNCIKEIKSPCGKINTFDCKSDLNLIASFEWNTQVTYVWNADTGEIVKEINLMECHTDMIFLPEWPYLAVAWDEGHHGSGVAIYSIETGEEVLELEADNDAHNGDCVVLVLTPEGHVLCGGNFCQYKIDYKDMKVVEKKEIYQFPFDFDEYLYLPMSCSKSSYTFCVVTPSSELVCVNVSFSSAGKVEIRQEIITHCFVKGKEVDLLSLCAVAHDGENIIVAIYDKIIALETATEGTIGHVIVSSSIPFFEALPEGQLKINHKGHLMVCNGSDIISVYHYKDVINSLQGHCRHKINRLLNHDKSKVTNLPIPNTLKSYLLYKV